jgi:lysophospholipase L1-like esterase
MLAAISAALVAASAASAQTAPGATDRIHPRPQPVPIKASKIILVGDSTMQANSGWGGSFCANHVTSSLACVNLGRGGRSTYSYRAEGSWDLALAEMKTAGFAKTYVLIQFGHNDQPGKPGRSTDLATEFPQNLRRYVGETRAAGAVPILVTPLTRRQFKDGKLVRDLDAWGDAVRRIAAETKTPMIDLLRRSSDTVEVLGAAGAARFAQLPPSPEVASAMISGTTITANIGTVALASASVVGQNDAQVERLGDPKLSFDYTHLGQAGADFFSKLVVDELAVAMPQLRPQLIP